MLQFDRFCDELLDWNQRFNLTAITDPRAVETKHFLDSLACLLADIPQGATLLDVGAGAGFPGLPLKIARPDIRVTLLEATQKKARFLEHVTRCLDLHGVETVPLRAELYEARERFDVVVARALAELPVLLELTLPFCAVGGQVLAMKKGRQVADELRAAGRALQILGGELAEPLGYTIEGETRQILVVRKVRSGAAGYPRRPGVPAKDPL